MTELRGARVKKRLVVNEEEAGVVRRIYDPVLGREGPSLEVKAIAVRLNGEGLTFRGKPFHIAAVHRILTARTYTGVHHFNRKDSRTGESKPPQEWETVQVPVVIGDEDFEEARATLAARNPRKVPPRLVSNPTLLIGIARCGTCGDGMTLRTGKNERYRYYTCAGCAQKGPTVGTGRAISMAALHGMVIERMTEELLTPARLAILLEAFVDQSAEADSGRRARLALARQRQTGVERKLTRLLQMVSMVV